MAKDKKPTPDNSRLNDIGAKAKPFIERMEHLDAEMKGYREEIAESKKIVLEEAEADGIQPKALKRILRLRKLQQQIAELPEKLEDIDARAQFAALAEAFGDTPFGQHARSLAEITKDLKADGVDVSVQFAGHPGMDRLDAMQREDEEHLQQVGRGHSADDIDQIAG